MASLRYLGLCILLVVIVFACGGEASPSTTGVAVTATPGSPAATVAPVATPAITSSPAPRAQPAGTLEVAVADLGSPVHLLHRQSLPQSRFDLVVTHEPMFATAPDGTTMPRLVKEWSADPSGLTYIFHIQEGVRWQRGWGEFTADDFIFTLQQVSREDSTHVERRDVQRIYTCGGCELTKLDRYTVQLRRPTPTYEVPWHSRSPGGGFLAFHSQAQYENAGEARANQESVGTGPWELFEVKDGEFRKVRAVQDHWRKTPEFQEMVWWDIPDGANRAILFLSYLLDATAISVKDLELVKNDPGPGELGTQFMSVPGATIHYMNLYGQQYYTDAPSHQSSDGSAPPLVPVEGSAYGCSLPWVSCDRDVESEEWERARKVRLAMAMAIDRQKLIDGVAFGEGVPWSLTYWAPGERSRIEQFDLNGLGYDYDPAKTRQLLEEAGYPNGFTLDMVLGTGFTYGPNQAAAAVAEMWEDVGIKVLPKRLEASAYLPSTYRREARFVQSYNPSPAWPVEPIQLYERFYSASSVPNLGFEHPWFQGKLDQAHTLMDDQARWAVQAEMARWIFDNVMTIPLFAENAVWPLSTNIKTWELQGGDPAFLSNWEFVPHRR